MKKRVIQFISFILVVVLVIAYWIKCENVFRPTASDISIAQVEGFHTLPKDSIDVIVYGSSHSWRGINTKYMYDEYGINAYNYSCMWQRINTTQLFVDDSLLTQTPKIAIVDVSRVGEFLEDTGIVGEVYYTRSLKNTRAKELYLRECFGDNKERYLAYYLPFCALHAGWEDLEEANFKSPNSKPEDFVESRGFLGFDTAEHVDITDGSDFWEQEIPDKSMPKLNDIVKACNEKGVKIIFVTVPFFSGEFYYRDALSQYAADNGCDYIDMFSEINQIELDPDEDFSEADHLNVHGATKVADYLSKYILENYGSIL